MYTLCTQNKITHVKHSVLETGFTQILNTGTENKIIHVKHGVLYTGFTQVLYTGILCTKIKITHVKHNVLNRFTQVLNTGT